MDLEDKLTAIWHGVLLLMVITLLGFIFWFFKADRRIRYYYLAKGMETKACIYADTDWYPDDKVTCHDNVPEAIEWVKQLNTTIR